MKLSLDIFDTFPPDMLTYLQHYGFHFNKKACEYALTKMGIKPIDFISKSYIDGLFTKFNLNTESDVLYDSMFVANLAKHKLGFLNFDECKLGQFVKLYLETGNVFCKWNSVQVHDGDPIEWSDLI